MRERVKQIMGLYNNFEPNPDNPWESISELCMILDLIKRELQSSKESANK